jgi:hypothetical protein
VEEFPESLPETRLTVDVNLGFSMRKRFGFINLHRKDPLLRIQYL